MIFNIVSKCHDNIQNILRSNAFQFWDFFRKVSLSNSVTMARELRLKLWHYCNTNYRLKLVKSCNFTFCLSFSLTCKTFYLHYQLQKYTFLFLSEHWKDFLFYWQQKSQNVTQCTFKIWIKNEKQTGHYHQSRVIPVQVVFSALYTCLKERCGCSFALCSKLWGGYRALRLR